MKSVRLYSLSNRYHNSDYHHDRCTRTRTCVTVIEMKSGRRPNAEKCEIRRTSFAMSLRVIYVNGVNGFFKNYLEMQVLIIKFWLIPIVASLIYQNSWSTGRPTPNCLFHQDKSRDEWHCRCTFGSVMSSVVAKM